MIKLAYCAFVSSWVALILQDKRSWSGRCFERCPAENRIGNWVTMRFEYDLAIQRTV